VKHKIEHVYLTEERYFLCIGRPTQEFNANECDIELDGQWVICTQKTGSRWRIAIHASLCTLSLERPKG